MKIGHEPARLDGSDRVFPFGPNAGAVGSPDDGFSIKEVVKFSVCSRDFVRY
jgi:hypothetical protein